MRPFLVHLYSQIFFLFNFIGFGAPLAATNFISILGYKYLLTKKFLKVFTALISVVILYAIIHLIMGVNLTFYLKSSAYYFFLLISCYVTFKYLKSNLSQLEKIFDFSCISAFVLFLAGLLLYNTEFGQLFWKTHDFVGTGNVFKRYQGLAYEPSHYALIISPLVIYSFLNLYLGFTVKRVLLFFAVFIPMLATISFGFLGSFFVSFIVLIAFVYTKYGRIERFFLLLLSIGIIAMSSAMFSNEGLRERITGIFSGHDTSVNGRTFQAFYLGYKCAEQKSLIFGIGAGQIKVIGEDVIRPYYAAWDPIGYSSKNWPVMALPNTAAETLAMYGILGLILRLGLQLYLFYRLKVYNNYFNLFLFFFMFSYQLMGSFFTSTAEATLWVMCFIPMFPKFQIALKKGG